MAAAFSAYPQFGRFVLRFPHIFGAAAGIRTICLPCLTDRWPGPGEARLLPGRFAQRGVDAVLPARSVGLEKIEDVAVETQRDHLSCARQ